MRFLRGLCLGLVLAGCDAPDDGERVVVVPDPASIDATSGGGDDGDLREADGGSAVDVGMRADAALPDAAVLPVPAVCTEGTAYTQGGCRSYARAGGRTGRVATRT